MKAVCTFALMFYLTATYSQGLMYYPFTSQISVSSNPTKVLWVDSKWQTNSFFSNFNTELAPHINISTDARYRMYVGAGARVNFVTLLTSTSSRFVEGYFGTFGVRSSLFPAYPRLQVGFEFSPYVNRQATLGLFRTNLGIGYYFGK